MASLRNLGRSAAGALLGALMIATVSPVLPQAVANSTAIEYGQKLAIELDEFDSKVFQFGGEQGDRVVIEHLPGTYSGQSITVRDSSASVIFSATVYYYTIHPTLTLPTTGQYTVEIGSYSQPADATLTLHKARDHVFQSYRVGDTQEAGVNIGDTVSFEFSANANQRVSFWVDQSAEDAIGYYGSFVLRDLHDDSVLWDGSSQSHGEGTYIQDFSMPRSGRYRLEFMPGSSDAGSFTLASALVPEAEVVEIAEGEWASSRTTVPGQDVVFRFTGEAGQTIRIQDRVLPWDSEVRLIGPTSTVQATDALESGDLVFLLPESGTYDVVVDGNRETGGAGLRYLLLNPEQSASITAHDTPVVLGVVSRDRLRFELNQTSTAGIQLNLATGDSVSGWVRLKEIGQQDSVTAMHVVEGESTGVYVLDSAVAGQYTLEFTPDQGSSGTVSGWTSEPSSANEEVVLVPNGGEVASEDSGMWGTTQSLEPDTTYRLVVRSSRPIPGGASIWVSGAEVWIGADLTSGSGAIEFTTPTQIDPLDDTISWWLSTAGGTPATHLSVELHSNVGTPRISGPGKRELWDDTSVVWTVDSVEETLAGYAVLVDQNATSDPGLTATQIGAGITTPLAAGTHWVHVRGISASGPGPVAHAKVTVAEKNDANLPVAPSVSSLTGGAASQTPRLELATSSAPATVDKIRLIVQTIDGQASWSEEVAPVNGVATATPPEDLFVTGHRYTASAQFLYENEMLSPRGADASFVFSPTAPRSPADPCSSECNPVDVVLFEGTLAPDASANLDLSDLAVNPADWVGDAHLSIRSKNTSENALLNIDPGVPGLDLDQPTLTISALQVATATVVPSGADTTNITNIGSHDANLEVTATGWVSGRDAKEIALEETVEDGIAQLEAADEPMQTASTPVLEPTETAFGPCLPDKLCVGPGPTQNTPEDEFGPLNRGIPLRSGPRHQARAQTSFIDDSIPRPTSWGASSWSDDCLWNLNQGWEVLDRFNACRLTSVHVKHWTPYEHPLYWYDRNEKRILVEEQLKTYWNEQRITHRIRFMVYDDSDALKPLQANVSWDCEQYFCENVPAEVTSNTLQLFPNFDPAPTPWVTSEIRPKVEANDSLPRNSVGRTFDVVYNFDGAYLPDIGTNDAREAMPQIRCDSGDKSFYGGNPKNQKRPVGCILTFANTPTFFLDASRYPNHADLIVQAQDELVYSPGRPPFDEESLLTPLSVGEWKDRKRHRQAATAMCREQKVKFTCDEYPYASSRQGCFHPSVPAILRCRVKGVRGRENYGAGAQLGWFMRKQRLMIDEEYYVAPFNPVEPM